MRASERGLSSCSYNHYKTCTLPKYCWSMIWKILIWRISQSAEKFLILPSQNTIWYLILALHQLVSKYKSDAPTFFGKITGTCKNIVIWGSDLRKSKLSCSQRVDLKEGWFRMYFRATKQMTHHWKGNFV